MASGKASRDKGAAWEREVVHLLRAAGFSVTGRNLDQSREGGADIHAGPYAIECKRRARIALHEWMDQAQAAAGDLTPLVVAKADRKPALAIMLLEDWLKLVEVNNA